MVKADSDGLPVVKFASVVYNVFLQAIIAKLTVPAWWYWYIFLFGVHDPYGCRL